MIPIRGLTPPPMLLRPKGLIITPSAHPGLDPGSHPCFSQEIAGQARNEGIGVNAKPQRLPSSMLCHPYGINKWDDATNTGLTPPPMLLRPKGLIITLSPHPGLDPGSHPCFSQEIAGQARNEGMDVNYLPRPPPKPPPRGPPPPPRLPPIPRLRIRSPPPKSMFIPGNRIPRRASLVPKTLMR